MLAIIQSDYNTHDDLHENKFVAIVIVVMIFGFAIWKAWPALIANNVFSKKRLYDYGRGEELMGRKRSYAFQLLAGIFLLGLYGLGLMAWSNINPADDSQFGHFGIFGLSLIGAIAILIYTALDEAVFTTHNLKYTLKVWLTTIFTAPIVLVLMDWHRIVSFKWLLSLYYYTVLLGYGISMVSFLVFVLAVHYITIKFAHIPARRLRILITALVSLLLNMFVVSLVLRSSGAGWLLELLPYSVVAGLCIWFYAMDKTIYTEAEFYETETEN